MGFKSGLVTTCVLALLVGHMCNAQASVYRVEIDVVFNQESSVLPLFGVESGDLPYSTSISFVIDALVAPEIYIPAGTGGIPYTHDLYGYSLAALSNLSEVRFGTKVWDISDLTPRTIDGNDGYVWVDTPLSANAVTRMFMRFSDTDGSFFFGGAAGSNLSLSLLDIAFVDPAGTIGRVVGDMSVNVSEVPVPAAAWLFGSGLVGLIGLARRKT